MLFIGAANEKPGNDLWQQRLLRDRKDGNRKPDNIMVIDGRGDGRGDTESTVSALLEHFYYLQQHDNRS